MTTEKIKHLEFIQNIITRMNTNSFQIKGWTITLVSAALALFAATKNYHFVGVGVVPAVVFWFLDAYYLQQERKFRELYKDVALDRKADKIKPFMMRPDLYEGGKFFYFRVVFSTTIWPMYLSIILLLIGFYEYLKLIIK